MANPPADAPYDMGKASRALIDFAVVSLTLGGRYPDSESIPTSVLEDVSRKTDEALKAGLASLAEVARLRGMLKAMRETHLPMPSTTPGLAIICQACSMDGTPVPWKCAMWKFADDVLADGH